MSSYNHYIISSLVENFYPIHELENSKLPSEGEPCTVIDEILVAFPIVLQVQQNGHFR